MNLKMKIALLIAGLAFAGISNGCTSDKQTDQKAEVAGEYYTCPMHPSVRSDRPGSCPVCGMALVKKSAQQDLSDTAVADFKGVALSPAQRVMANITTVAVEREELQKKIDVSGVVGYAEPLQATVTARFRGRIEKVLVDFTGERVKKGQPLIEIYSPDLISAVREYQLAMENARVATSAKSGEMQDQLASIGKERLKLHFGFTDQQIANLEHAASPVSSIVFHSPISGTVVEKQVVVGQYVDEGNVLYKLADLSRVWAYFDVYEKDIRFIKSGLSIEVSSEAYPAEKFTGRVTFIDPVINPATRTIRVRTEFSNPAGKLKPNMYVNGKVLIPVHRALVAPITAVVSTGQRTVVWVETGKNQFEPRDVTIGVRTDSQVQILNGLREGEMIASTGGYLIESESALQTPSAVDPHAGHGTEPKPAEHIHGESALPSPEEITITVDGKYTPNVVHLTKGQPVRLNFRRNEDSDCTEEVVLEGFGIRKKLKAWDTTTIELTPEKTGETLFTCGMNMIEGRIIVHD